MRLLCLDTATERTSVALVDDERGTWARHHDDPYGHAEVCAVLVEQVLREAGVTVADLSGIVCGVGPGPFTGLRVAVVTALTLGRCTGLPVIGVCSLDLLAAGALPGPAADPADPVVPVLTDARRREVYWAGYRGWSRVVGPLIAPRATATGQTPPMAAAAAVRLLGWQAQSEGSPWGPAVLRTWQERLARLPAATLGAPDSPGGDVPAGVLLPVRPLYLRRPHATEPPTGTRPGAP